MKIYGKWLVVTTKNRVVATFMTKKEAIEALNHYMKPIGDGKWLTASNVELHIEKNTKEYR